MWRANRGKTQREEQRQTVQRKESGFTLIELLLAMSFLSVLLIAITTSTLQIIGLYTKGVTLKSINLAGRDVADSFRRDALASADGIRYVSPDKGGGLGRLCFGTMSYVWSPAAKLQQGSAIRYQNDTRQGDVRGDMIVLARVADAGAQYCNPTARGTYSTDVFLSKATELLGSREGGFGAARFADQSRYRIDRGHAHHLSPPLRHWDEPARYDQHRQPDLQAAYE